MSWYGLWYTRHSFHFISFHLAWIPCCVAWDWRSIRPMSSCNFALMTGFAAQRSGSGSSNMLWPRQWNHPLVCFKKSMPVACHDADRLDSKVIVLWTWGRHSLEVSNTQFSEAISPAWSCHLVRLREHVEMPTLLNDPLLAARRVQLQKLPSWSRSQFLKENTLSR